jgi:Winged helix DNA-binding domain
VFREHPRFSPPLTQTAAASVAGVAAAERVLTRRELNRALLQRQLLLERRAVPVARAVERLGGLQAQSTPSPYLALWTRLEGFERDELVRALSGRRVVKALLQRGTLHIVSPRDYWSITTARRTLGGSLWPPSYEARVPAARIAQLANVVLGELREGERTFAEIRALLEPHAKPPHVTPTFLWRRVQGQAYVMHVPPSGIWGYGGQGVYTAAEGRLRGGPPEPEDAFDDVVRRYLAAYGPASKQDIGQWAGIPRLTPIAESLARLQVRTFRDGGGRVLHDLPRGPLPDPETPAPVRLVPRFDNLVLSHADRSRILGDIPPSRLVTKNGIVHATMLVDGFVAGTWQLEQGRVVLEPFGRLAAGVKRALKEEAERLEAFVA